MGTVGAGPGPLPVPRATFPPRPWRHRHEGCSTVPGRAGMAPSRTCPACPSYCPVTRSLADTQHQGHQAGTRHPPASVSGAQVCESGPREPGAPGDSYLQDICRTVPGVRGLTLGRRGRGSEVQGEQKNRVPTAEKPRRGLLCGQVSKTSSAATPGPREAGTSTGLPQLGVTGPEPAPSIFCKPFHL